MLFILTSSNMSQWQQVLLVHSYKVISQKNMTLFLWQTICLFSSVLFFFHVCSKRLSCSHTLSIRILLSFFFIIHMDYGITWMYHLSRLLFKLIKDHNDYQSIDYQVTLILLIFSSKWEMLRIQYSIILRFYLTMTILLFSDSN